MEATRTPLATSSQHPVRAFFFCFPFCFEAFSSSRLRAHRTHPSTKAYAFVSSSCGVTREPCFMVLWNEGVVGFRFFSRFIYLFLCKYQLLGCPHISGRVCGKKKGVVNDLIDFPHRYWGVRTLGEIARYFATSGTVLQHSVVACAILRELVAWAPRCTSVL